MPRKSTVVEAPFMDGSLQHYPSTRWDYHNKQPDGRATLREPEWRQNKPFYATLCFKQMARGRSAAYAVWKDLEDHEFPMFLSDLAEVISVGIVQGGFVRSEWIIKKRGANYGVGLYKG